MNQAVFDRSRQSIQEAFRTVAPPERSIGVFANALFGAQPEAPISTVSSWMEVTLEVLDDGPHGRRGDMLTSLRGATWRHYLPAWLLIGLEATPRSLELSSIALRQLWPDQPGRWTRKEFDERTDGLTTDQRTAIGFWIRAMLSLDPDKVAALRGVDLMRASLTRAWIDRLPAA